MTANFHHDSDRVMTNEQFTEVVGAILEGKYSWACVLILKFSGFNPLHYIPYRTYNRLMKDNCPRNSRRNQSLNTQKREEISHSIRDLTYLESVEKKAQKVKGGTHTCFDHHPWRIPA